jgi:NAD(P)-dependent dehydrogenase (short-subunit alcohol dehydrogenase family)
LNCPINPRTSAAKDASRLEDDLNASFRTNVTGNILLITAFLPLVRAGKLKKIVAISSGMAAIDLVVDFDIYQALPYSSSKAALNMAVAKLQAELKPEGILVFAISPGIVATGNMPGPEHGEKVTDMVSKLMAYEPEWKGPITPDESVGLVLEVVAKATIETTGGRMVSHRGNTRWL